jgi:hypothetical protein
MLLLYSPSICKGSDPSIFPLQNIILCEPKEKMLLLLEIENNTKASCPIEKLPSSIFASVMWDLRGAGGVFNYECVKVYSRNGESPETSHP